MDLPGFFIPGTAADEQERMYVKFADMCRSSVPPPGKRIYSINYVHDGVDWTATVGETLRGIERREGSPQGAAATENGTPWRCGYRDGYFSWNPYKVVTNGFQTRWANPFFVGEPRHIQFFATSSASSGMPPSSDS